MGPEDAPAGLRDQSIGDLLKRLSDETATLVRQEIELAKAELAQKGREAGAGAGMLGGAGAFGLLALGALTACVILALDLAMAGWLAALIVAVVEAAIAGAMALMGRERMRRASPPIPEQAIETTKEDARWVKTRARSGGR